MAQSEIRSTDLGCIQDLVEGLRDELKLRDSLIEEGTPQEGLQQDAVPEAIKQHVSDLIESSAEVDSLVPSSAAVNRNSCVVVHLLVFLVVLSLVFNSKTLNAYCQLLCDHLKPVAFTGI